MTRARLFTPFRVGDTKFANRIITRPVWKA